MMKKKIKPNALLAMILSIMCIACYPQTVKADVNVKKMDIDIAIRKDGSAVVTQEWDSDTDEGSEFYLYQKDSGFLEFSNLQVKDSKKTYKFVDEWDVDEDFDEKAYKCGINEVDDGVELCWGISEYGKNHYTITYELGNLMRAYKDNDGCLYRFVNADMQFFPTDVNLTIRMEDNTPINPKNAKIWGFGYEGSVNFADGKIVAKTKNPLEDDMNMTLMICMDKGIIKPAMSVDETFDDVIDLALEDSDYDKEGNAGNVNFEDNEYIEDEFGEESDFWILMIVIGVIFFGVGIIVIIIVIDFCEVKKLKKNAPYFWSVPNNGNINATYVLAKNCSACKEGALFGARITRLILANAISVKKNDNEKFEVLYLNKEVSLGDYFDIKLFEMLQKAAGKDNVLTVSRIKKYCEKHYSKFEKYLKKCEKDGKLYLENNGYVKKKFNSRHDLNDVGLKELYQVLGLRKYLKDYGKLEEKTFDETYLWKELLPYATLFDLSKEFGEGLKVNHSPDISDSEFETDILPFILFCNCSHNYSNAMHASMSEASIDAGISGAGGSSSFGGGAGFSGGGGGGVR